MKVECFFDGCCEPVNPGGAMGIGALVKLDDVATFQFSYFVPAASGNTNNIAEYMALEKVIDWILEEKIDTETIVIKGDSQLAIKQMTGEYGMNSGAYIPYAKRCLTKIASFRKPPQFLWIPRDQNNEADDLSKGKLAENKISVETNNPQVLGFGKYKGKKLDDISDMQYLKWVLKEVKLKDPQRTAIEGRITQFEFLAK